MKLVWLRSRVPWSGAAVATYLLGLVFKRKTRYVQADAQAVDLTPWKPAPIVGAILIVSVLIIYLALAK